MIAAHFNSDRYRKGQQTCRTPAVGSSPPIRCALAAALSPPTATPAFGQAKRTRKGCSLMQELAGNTVKGEENMTLQRRGLLLVVTLAAALFPDPTVGAT